MTRYFGRLAALTAVLWSVFGETPASSQDAGSDAIVGVQPLWSSQCTTTSREAPPDCAIEQRAVVTESGQLLIKMTVQVPADTRKPVMMIQAPLGPFLPAGINMDVDGNNPFRLDYQTCDANGCYAGSPISDELLQRMIAGHKLNVTIQALNKQPVRIPMVLTGFTAAYRNIQ